MSIASLGGFIVIFAFTGELRSTVHGKMVLGYAISLFCYMCPDMRGSNSVLYHITEFLKFLGLEAAVLWNIVMAFDICLTMITFSKSFVVSKRFWFYGAFVFSVSLFFLVLLTWTWVYGIIPRWFYFVRNYSELFLLWATALFLVLAGFKAHRMSKALSRSESSRFKDEMTR